MASLRDRGIAIRHARERAGINREQLAVIAETSVSTIVRLENKGQLPNVETLARITHELGISLDDLMAKTGPAVRVHGTSSDRVPA